MKKELLIQVVDLLYQFDADNQGDKSDSLQDFVSFLNTRMNTESLSMRKIEGDTEQEVQVVRRDNNSDAGILITLMYRYARGYIKKALQDSSIQTSDEFAFLITLMTFESLTKTELINKQVMEKTSGVEVIKRLVGQDMIQELADPNDKRSVRVSITPKGRAEVYRVLPEMAKVSRIVVGNLSAPEISTLIYLLKKLDFFHNDIFLNMKSLDLDTIMQETGVTPPEHKW